MKSRLPATPMEALSISGALAAVVKIIHTFAHIFGFWNRPPKKLAGDFEAWSLMDKMYWGFKSKNPVKRAEKGSGLETFFKENDKTLTLPDCFEEKHSLTFGAVGDLIKVDGLEHSQDILYENTAHLVFDKDISYGNLESQLTSRGMETYTFSDKETPPLCCTTEQYDALKSHRGKQYTFMHTACNHTLDMGLEGLETTLARLEKDNIIDLGTNREPAEQRRGRIIEKNGIKAGFVSATFGLNGKEVPEGKEYMVNVVKFHPKNPSGNPPDLALLEEQIAYCREQGCDVVIASLHWGYEYEFYPRSHQVDAAHAVIEAGADVIVSHHAHVIQPVEYYRPKRDPRRTAVIAYSLGNLTTSFSAPHLVLSAILNLTFVKGTVKGEDKTFIREAAVIPVVQIDSMENDLPVIRLETLDAFSGRKDGTADEKNYISAVNGYAKMILGELECLAAKRREETRRRAENKKEGRRLVCYRIRK
jgi:poly-gamma-glutamate synthesis protein (capsule biosynthesis protein)